LRTAVRATGGLHFEYAALVLDAHELAAANQIAWFNALILEAAIRSQCSVLYSEDFHGGQHCGGLEIRNPFAIASLP
jgi:predicted nucleic acid-binding protein